MESYCFLLKIMTRRYLTGVEVAKQLEAGGADLIAVHGRTREQMYIPPIDTAAIAAIKQAVSIPQDGKN